MPYKKGQSGNPKGRPKGIANKRGIVAGVFEAYKKDKGIDAKDTLINSLITQALEGDTSAAKILIDRLEPAYKPIGRTIELPGRIPKDLYKKAEKILTSAMSGSMAIDEAKQLLSGLADVIKVKEIIELEQRLEALEDGQTQLQA